MNRLREIMRDKRAAGTLAVVALLLVGYRLLPLRGTGTGVMRPSVESAGVHREEMPSEGTEPAPAAPGFAGLDRSEPGVSWSWQRNPFLPVGSAGSVAAGPVLSTGPSDPGEGRGMPADLRGTVVAGRVGIAIFGSRLVPVGGKIGDWTVEQVEPYRVAMRKGSETRVVEMFKPATSGAEARGGKR